MPKQLETSEDVKDLVDTFYARVRKDADLRPIFEDVAKVDWEGHLPIMYAFWEMILLGGNAYKGNPMTPHLQLNRLFPLTDAHFAKWLHLFYETVDELFKGDKAEEAKSRATNIAGLIRHKINA